eukprot:11079742-Ditylum_brightwellii.AAC.1
MTSIRSDPNVVSATCKRHRIKIAATYLLSFCPVLRKHPSDTKCDAIMISDTAASGFGIKPSAVTSGVSLRYHILEEYEFLSQPQKDVFQECHNKFKWGQSRKAQGQGEWVGGQSSKCETYKQ